jgi:Zn-dependent M16 (insulinase) family peptidase
MSETLADFDNSLQWLFDKPIASESIEESILGIISSLDKPGSPAGEAKQEFHAQLTGRTREIREQYRERIIHVNADDLRRVAQNYLSPEKASVAVVTGNHGINEAEKLNLDIIKIGLS